MAITAIISNFNGLKYLPRLLDSLKSQQGVELEIVIVDRQSTDGSVEYIQTLPEVVWVTEPPESGLVAGYHAGTKVATKGNYFFCNEDMWFESDCLVHLERNLNPEKGIIATDPWQWSYDGLERIHAGTRFKSCRFSLNSPHPFYAADFDCDLATGSKVPFPCAGAFLITSDAYRALGGWDLSFFLNHEDTDLFLRAWQREMVCISVPEAKVYHAAGSSNQKTIQGGRLQVGKRRYVSSFSSSFILVLKYFTGTSVAWGGVSFLVRILGNLLRLRFKYCGWDFLVLLECLSRFPLSWRFRFQNSERNRSRPGQAFYTASEFSS
jgi:GT2 family glycosyltransferase